MYATFTPEDGRASIVRLTDKVFIPIDEQNRDYKRFLAWVEEGNTPKVWNDVDGTATTD